MDTKTSSTKYVVGIIVAVVVIIIFTLLSSNGNKETSTETPAPAAVENRSSTVPVQTPQAAPAAETPTTQASKAIVVNYTDSGFSPETISIKVGDTVTFVNQSSESMWVASAMHPSHAVYSGTTLNEHCPDTAGVAFDQCNAGDSYSFTFQKAGTWAYHNHTNASKYGKIVVK